jgi:acyl-coenzyme A thioesterase PaaI-like protein
MRSAFAGVMMIRKSMSTALGNDIVDVSKGGAVVAAEPHGKQLNAFGTVHGGLAATLLDSCMGPAVLSCWTRALPRRSCVDRADNRQEGVVQRNPH